MNSLTMIPPIRAWNSPKSTSASAPGAWVCGTATSAGVPTSSRRIFATAWVTVDSARVAPCSSTSRCQTRRAVWRCLRGASRSATSHALMIFSHGPMAGDSRTGSLRGGGVESASAARTVRRCTPWTRASSRTDISFTLASRRIRSNCSTLDLSFKPVPFSQSWTTKRTLRAGRGWGQFKRLKALQVGPFQDAIPRPSPAEFRATRSRRLAPRRSGVLSGSNRCSQS